MSGRSPGRVFVIHDNRDFERVLADQLVFTDHYLLVGWRWTTMR
jgi:hypothetical protein